MDLWLKNTLHPVIRDGIFVRRIIHKVLKGFMGWIESIQSAIKSAQPEYSFFILVNVLYETVIGSLRITSSNHWKILE